MSDTVGSDTIGIKVEAPNLEGTLAEYARMFDRILDSVNDANVKVAAFKALRTVATRTGASQTSVSNCYVGWPNPGQSMLRPADE